MKRVARGPFNSQSTDPHQGARECPLYQGPQAGPLHAIARPLEQLSGRRQPARPEEVRLQNKLAAETANQPLSSRLRYGWNPIRGRQ